MGFSITVSKITSNYGSTRVESTFLCGGIAHTVLKIFFCSGVIFLYKITSDIKEFKAHDIMLHFFW